MGLKKGKFVFLGILLIFALLLSACSGSSGGKGENLNLVISHFLPSTHPIETEIFKEFGDTLNKESDGRITYDTYPANSLGAANAHYDMAVTGEADVALSVHGYTPGRFPLVSVLELPFLSESGEHGSKIIAKLLEEFPEFKEEHGDTVPLWLFSADPAQIISKNYRIETPEDLEGLRVRSPSPLANKIIEHLGGVPVSMPMGDVYEALDRGVIDAAMVPLEALYNYNFYEIAKYVTVGHFSSTPFFSVMNKDTYDSLSDSEKKVLEKVSGFEMSAKSGRVFDVDAEKGVELSKEKGAEFIELTGDKLKPWQDALQPIVEEWIAEMEKEGFDPQKIYDRAMELKEEVRE